MSTRVLLMLLALLLGLRAVAFSAHEHPRGDVLLDVGVARELASGNGFESGFERGVVRVAGADSELPPQGVADQHPPLWPALGALPTALGVSPFTSLKWLGLLASLLLLALLLRSSDRLLEGVIGADARLSTWLVAIVGSSFVMVDSSGNGSLYAAQALGVLLLVELISAARPAVLRVGLVLGLLVQLNHQCLVLFPLPLVIAGLSAPAGRRSALLLRAVAALGVALLVQVPWWLRNAELFGDAFFSVNGLYLLYRAGVPTFFAVESGVPVLRLVGELGLGDMPRLLLGNLRQNLPWFAAALPLATASLALPALAGTPSLLAAAWRRREARVLALLLATALLLAAALLWPATKLRYLIPLVPLISLLGVRVLAEAPTQLTRWLARGLAAGWLALLLLTLDDITTSGPSAHPERWFALAGACVLCVLAAWGGHVTRRAGLAVGALLVALTLSASVALLARLNQPDARPATAYHSTWFLPDVFGADAEVAAERRADELKVLAKTHAALRRTLSSGTAHLARVLGPLDLLVRSDLDLLELPSGLPGEWLAETLAAWLPAQNGLPVESVVLSRQAVEQLPAELRDRLEPMLGMPSGEWAWFSVRAP